MVNLQTYVVIRSKKENKNLKGKGGGGGFTKVCSLSPELQKFTGVPELARTEVLLTMYFLYFFEF